MYNLNYDIFKSFRDMISIEKIRNFHSECINYQKENHIKENSIKITKHTFMKVFQKIFSLDQNYIDLYELFYKRFKNNKCIFKTEKNKENYILCDIISTGDIDIYNIEIALIVFYKCDFFKKIKIIFELTDIDNDGLINDVEIKKMIFTINNLFPKDVNQFKADSHLINQSLSNVYAKEIYRSIMYNPGKLGKIILKEKYINFEVFYNELIKIHNYKYKFLPLYVNIMDCLLEEKKEIEYNMNNTILNDFISVSNELICQSNLKYNQNEAKTNIKTILDENIFNKKQKIDTKIDKNIKTNTENENKIKQIKVPKLSSIKKSSSMTNLDIDNLIKNKINKLSRFNKYNNNKCFSPLYSTAVSSIYHSKNQNQNKTTIQIPKKIKKKKQFSLNNSLKNSKKLNIHNNSYGKLSIINKKKKITNYKSFYSVIKNDDKCLNYTSSYINHNTDSSFNEKNLNNSIKIITQKANYDKLVNLQFPPCKIISMKNILSFPKISYNKKNKKYLSPSKSNYLLKTRNEINEDINKIKERINYRKENDSLNDLMRDINIQKKSIFKYVGKGKYFSPHFFNFKYQPINDSIII